jgi:hypothetical protein
LEITLIVSEPKDIALEIEKELIEAMVPNSVSFDENQNISILIPVNSTTIKLMLNRRIELPQQEYCKIVITRKQ